MPVLQGWEYWDYLGHLDQYRAAGIDLATRMAEQLAADLWQRGLNIHGFGFKTLGLAKCARYLASADSLAWREKVLSTAARSERRWVRLNLFSQREEVA